VLPYSEKFLQQKRGASLKDIETEVMDIEKGTKTVIKKIFHGIIIKIKILMEILLKRNFIIFFIMMA
jgi:hypothetical protein